MKTQTTIRNGDKSFAFVCPKLWDQLSLRENERERFCDQGKQVVYLCLTDEETLDHAKSGDCIAREIPDNWELPRIILGRSSQPVPHAESETRALQVTHREQGIDDSLKNLGISQRKCPKCGFPAPDWRKTCRVCEFEFGRVRPPQ